MASNLGKPVDQNFGPFLPPRPRWLNLIKVFSLFNTQHNRPRDSTASFKHVGQVLYSRGFKFMGKGPIKILVYFCLQVDPRWLNLIKIFSLFNAESNRSWASAASFLYTQPNRPRAPLQVSSMEGRSSTQRAANLAKMG